MKEQCVRVPTSPSESRLLVSVVIPVYNYGRFLAACLRSVCFQTVKDLEILVIDDGSTDDIERVIRLVSDERIRYVRTPHEGNYFARNRGVAEAVGEYIAFLDADDVWIAPYKLQAQIDVLRNHPKVGLCFSNEYVYDESSRTLKPQGCRFHGTTMDQSEIWRTLSGKWSINSSSVIVRRSCLEDVGPFDTAFHNAMDIELWSRILFRFDGYYDDRRLVIRRRHGRNHSENPGTGPAVGYAFRKVLENVNSFRRMTAQDRTRWNEQQERILNRLTSGRPARVALISILTRPPLTAVPRRLARRAYHRFLNDVQTAVFRFQSKKILSVLSSLENGGMPVVRGGKCS